MDASIDTLPKPKAHSVDWHSLRFESLMQMRAASPDQWISEHNEDNANGAIFGGQVLAQTLFAAGSTVRADRPVQVMQLGFVRSSKPLLPMSYAVERTGDGRSTSSRLVRVTQPGRTVCIATLAFQTGNSMVQRNDRYLPHVPEADSLPTIQELIAGHPKLALPYGLGSVAMKSSADLRFIEAADYLDRSNVQAGYQFWIRVPQRLPDTPLLHQAALAYLTDYGLAFAPTLPLMSVTQMHYALGMASVNHALWFARPCRADEWLLVDVASPMAAGGRGLAIAKVYSQSRQLVAVVSQELMYSRRDAQQVEG